MEVEQILADRKKTHGPFSATAKASQELKNVFYSNAGLCNTPLSQVQRESIDMILHKIARVAVGNPDLLDHWDDISGYATLVSKHLKEQAAK